MVNEARQRIDDMRIGLNLSIPPALASGGRQLLTAAAINHGGEIVGTGFRYRDDQGFAFLLRPLCQGRDDCRARG